MFHADFVQAVRNQIAEAQKVASGSGSEQDIAEAKIELEVGRIWIIPGLYYKNVCVLMKFSGPGKSAGVAQVD